MRKFLSFIDSPYFLGGLITLYTFSLFFIFNIDIETLRKSKLSEMASFITGAFTPVTFLLLIYQYSSQQKEIYRIQIRQEKQEKLKEISIQPNIYIEDFSLTKTENYDLNYEQVTIALTLKNSGRKITNIFYQIEFGEYKSKDNLLAAELHDQYEGHINQQIPTNAKIEYEIAIKIIYLDEMKYWRHTNIQISIDRDYTERLDKNYGVDLSFRLKNCYIVNSLEHS